MRTRWLELGEVLAEIQDSPAYRTLGFKNLQTYLTDRLEVSPRWAMHLTLVETMNVSSGPGPRCSIRAPDVVN